MSETRWFDVHTIVLHRNPDLEALAMAWIVEKVPGVRQRLGLREEVEYKYISAGPLRPEEWPEVDELDPALLEQKGYLFLDCGAGRFDQHAAVPNVGLRRDVLASIDLLAEGTGVLDQDPSLIPFVRLISESDRTGESVCAVLPYDKKGETPHVAQDIRTMVAAQNERFPDDPELVRRTFFAAMDGLEFLFARIVTEEFERTGTAPDPAQFDLRRMNFMTTDNACRGIREVALLEGATEEQAEARVRGFMGPVREAWWLREQDWQTAERDLKRARFSKISTAPKIRRSGSGRILFVSGESAARAFPQVARRNRADVILQFYPDGRFLVTRKGEVVGFDELAEYLRAADAEKRGGKVVEPEDLRSRGNSVVRVGGEDIPQFYYPGFAVGNRFSTNPDGLAVSSLTRDEVTRIVEMALGGLPLKAALKELFQS